MQLSSHDFRNEFYKDICKKKIVFSHDILMIIKIQYNIAIFEENYKEDNVPLLSTYAFLAI